jgi:hypothetical protein
MALQQMLHAPSNLQIVPTAVADGAAADVPTPAAAAGELQCLCWLELRAWQQ